MTTIPVYEVKDGEAYNGFTKTTTAQLVPTHNGVTTTVTRVALRRVPQRYDDYKDDLPCNYKRITKGQALQALHKAQYNYLMVSNLGNSILNHFNLPNRQYRGA